MVRAEGSGFDGFAARLIRRAALLARARVAVANARPGTAWRRPALLWPDLTEGPL